MLQPADIAKWRELIPSPTDTSPILVPPTLDSLPNELRKPTVTLRSDAEANHFRWWHVDTLLNQAADLLDRCFVSRRDFIDYSYRALEVRLAVEELAETTRIEAEERDAGSYTLAARESTARMANIGTQQTATMGFVNLNLRRAGELSPTILANLQQIAQCVALTSTIDFSSRTNPSYTCPFPDHQKIVREEHAKMAAISQFQFSVQEMMYQAEAQRLANETRQAELTGQLDLERLRNEWNEKSVGFREARLAMAQNSVAQRLLALKNSDGAFNFDDKAKDALRRMLADGADALERLMVAEKGLRLLFGYEGPAVPAGPNNDFTEIDIDELYLWCRTAIRDVVSFQHRDQTITLTLPLRQLLGDTAWDLGRTSGSWSLNVTNQTLLPGSLVRCGRLRALSATVSMESDLGRSDTGSWQLTIDPPEKGFYLAREADDFREIDQEGAPRCVIGRAERNDSPRAPERAGGDALFNLSPFGQWVVSCGALSTTGTSRASIANIILEFVVVCQLAPAP